MFGLQGNVMSGLPSNLGITVSLLSFRGGVAGGLGGGLTSIARKLGRLARSATRASRATLMACRTACRSANAGSFGPDFARNFSSSVFFAFAAVFSRSSKPVPLNLLTSLRFMRVAVRVDNYHVPRVEAEKLSKAITSGNAAAGESRGPRRSTARSRACR